MSPQTYGVLFLYFFFSFVVCLDMLYGTEHYWAPIKQKQM